MGIDELVSEFMDRWKDIPKGLRNHKGYARMYVQGMLEKLCEDPEVRESVEDSIVEALLEYNKMAEDSASGDEELMAGGEEEEEGD